MTTEAIIDVGLDEDLGKILHKLFQSGEDEVEIRHPKEGTVIYTKAEFYKTINQMVDKINDEKRSPAERVVEKQRLENVRKQQQIRLRTAMITADVREVDFDDENSFGKDINGESMDIDGMVFVKTNEYLTGIELKEHEVGAFIHGEMKKPPVRITSTTECREGQDAAN